MKFWQVLLLIAYSLGLTGGQLLFKRVAVGLNEHGGAASWLTALRDPALWAALTLYGAMTALWIWLLMMVPLSRAYPFIALCFILTPLLGSRVYGEPVGPLFHAGLAAVVVGLGLIFMDGKT